MKNRPQQLMSTMVEDNSSQFSHLESAISQTEQGQIEVPDNNAELHVVASVDGRRVTVTGKDEIVLKCGEASITLRRNGRIVIKGTYVETRAAGTNRIKGGSVQIN